MATVEETPDRLRPPQAQGGPALHPRPGQLRRRRPACPGCCTARSLRSPLAHARIVSIDTSAALAAPEGPRRHHRQGPRGAGARLDADAVRRHAGRAGHRQGALPGPGGRVRRRRRPLLRARRARADRRRVRAAAGGRRRAQGARRRRAGDPRRPRGQDRQPHLRLGGRRQGGDRRRVRATPTSSSTQDMLYPRCAPGADGDVRRGRRLRRGHRQAARCGARRRRRTRTARCTRSSPGCPSTRSASSRPTSAAASATRCRSTRATCARSSRSIVTGKPVKWMEDRSENLMSTGFARDYVMQRQDRGRRRDGQDPRRCAST